MMKENFVDFYNNHPKSDNTEDFFIS